jgi:hypothetical protein
LVVVLALATGAVGAAALANLAPARLADPPPILVHIAAATAGLALLAADTAPTGWAPFDAVLRAGLGIAVVLAAARAGSLATGWLASVCAFSATVAIAPAPWAPAAGLGVHLALVVAGLTSPAGRAVVAAAAIAPMGHLDWPLLTGAGAAATAVAVTPVLLAGLARAPRAVRAPVLATVGASVLLAAVGAVGGALAALAARDDVDVAVRAATDGLDLLGDDDDAARARLTEAAESFESAEATLRVWWARPALLVPAVAQQSRAVATMASTGADLSRSAVEASLDADLERVRPRDGTVDLVALAELADPLERSVASLSRAADRLDGVRSPLLVAPVADRLVDLRERVDGALGSAELAGQAVEVAPAMLGADGPRRYFLAFHNPAELRGIGGFMGSWAEMIVDRGRFELVRTGRLRELGSGTAGPGTLRVEGEEEFVARYGPAAARTWGLLSFTPDFPTLARLATQLYPQTTGASLDGVASLTPRAFAAFLELTGPIQVSGYPEALTPQNAERILLHEQYLRFPQDLAEDREEFLADATEVLFDRLTTGELPGPSGIAATLGRVVDSRDLMLFAGRPDEQALFDRMDATGSAERGAADSFGVVTQNFAGNKIDWFLRREISYDLTWDPPSGAVSAAVDVRLENRAPSAGLPSSIIGWGGDPGTGQLPVADGENLMLVTVYTTYPARSVTLDGEPVDFEAGTELGHHTVRLYLRIPAGDTRHLRVEVAGTVAPGARYLIRPLRQPTAEPDHIEVTMSVAGGWTVEAARGGRADGTRATGSWRATEPAALTVDVGPGPQRSLLDRLRGTP